MNHPEILLLGCGYTLSRVVPKIPADKILSFRSSSLNLKDYSKLSEVRDEYPSIKIIVDSVPPLHQEEDPLVGVKNVAKAFGAIKDLRMIYLSTTGVFGVEDGSFVDENSPSNPRNEWSRQRLNSEEIYNEAFASCVALRIPAIYGPGRGIGHAIKAGRYHLVDGGNRWTNRIQVEDLATVIATLTMEPLKTSLPKVLPICDDEPALAKDVVEFYCKKFSFPTPPSVTIEEARRAGSFTMTSNQRVLNSLMKNILKTPLLYPSYREGSSTEFE